MYATSLKKILFMMVSHTRHAKHVNVLYINNEYIHIQKELEEKNILTKN